jgi:hypothetical protein
MGSVRTFLAAQEAHPVVPKVGVRKDKFPGTAEFLRPRVGPCMQEMTVTPLHVGSWTEHGASDQQSPQIIVPASLPLQGHWGRSVHHLVPGGYLFQKWSLDHTEARADLS